MRVGTRETLRVLPVATFQHTNHFAVTAYVRHLLDLFLLFFATIS